MTLDPDKQSVFSIDDFVAYEARWIPDTVVLCDRCGALLEKDETCLHTRAPS